MFEYGKNINDELTKITREIDDTKRAKLKVVEQLDNFELIFREKAMYLMN